MVRDHAMKGGGVTDMRDNSEYISPSRNDSQYRSDAAACHHCRENFKPGQTRFVILDAVEFSSGWEIVSICMDCFKEPGSLTDCNIIIPNRYRRTCRGCDEPISNPDHRRFQWEVCSHRCYLRVYRKHRRRYGSTIDWKARHGDWPKCEVCDSPIEEKRSDTRFCSNTCRQWAYRQRKR